MQTEKRMVEQIYEKDPYLYFMERIYSSDKTEIEINFLTERLAIKPNHKILDLPCGYGRHAIPFASRGCQILGIDQSAPFISEGKFRAQQRGLSIDFRVGDMREINFQNEFDVVLMLGTSFGIFSKNENMDVLKKVSHSLKKGGKFCLEHYSQYYPSMVKKGIKRNSIFEFEGNFLLDRVFLHEQSNQIEYKRTYLFGDQRKDASIFMQMYSLEQLKIMFDSLGFKIFDIYGGPQGNLYTEESHLMMVLAQKM